MKKTRTTEIIIETDEIFVMRKSGEQMHALCERCGRQIEVTLTQPEMLIEDPDNINESPKGDYNANNASQKR
jgi:hypothetical protein